MSSNLPPFIQGFDPACPAATIKVPSDSFSGGLVSGCPATEAVTAGQLLSFTPTGWAIADASDASAAASTNNICQLGKVGIACADAAAGELVTVATGNLVAAAGAAPSGGAVGDPVYADPAAVGGLTLVKPAAPAIQFVVGYVANNIDALPADVKVCPGPMCIDLTPQPSI